MSVICHFFHRDFQKCEIMNLHLSKLAQRHIESKFVRINAEKTPFFVEKVRILINPRILLYYFITAIYLLSFVLVMFIMLNQWSRVQFDYLLCVICMHTVHQQPSSSSSSSIQLKQQLLSSMME